MESELKCEIKTKKELNNKTEGYKVYKKQEIYEEIDNVEKEVNKLYFEITNADTVSQYKRNLMMQKLRLLYSKAEAMIKGIERCKEHETKFLKKKYIICTILIVLNSVFLVVAPLLSVPVSLLLMMNMSAATKVISGLKNVKSEKALEEQLHKLDIVFHNCEMFLNKKSEKYMQNLKDGIEKEKLEAMILAYANDLLGYHLNGETIPEYSMEVENALIKMLQDDLQTDVASLEELLELAKSKLEYQTLNEDMDLGMNIITLERKKEEN